MPNTRDMFTSKRDITLKGLLDDTSPFFLDHLFGTKPDKSYSTFPEIPDFTHPRLLSAAEVDNLDVFYYLEKGRPMRAYQLMASSLNGRPNTTVVCNICMIIDDPQTNSISQKLTQEQQLRLQFELRNFALRHMSDTATGACISLCIMCNVDPVLIRVDFDVLMRISNYLKQVLF